MPVCLSSIVSIITGLFCCISKSNEFNLFPFGLKQSQSSFAMRRSMMERRRILRESMTEIPNRIMLSEIKEVYVSDRMIFDFSLKDLSGKL